MPLTNVFPAAIAIVLSALFSSAAVAESLMPSVKALKAEEPKRVLFVGNSYLYYNNSLHSHVLRMVFAARSHSTKGLIYKSATISGAAIFDHSIDLYLERGRLRVKKPFQVVILQGHSSASWKKGRDVKFRDTVAGFSAKIAAAGGETALYMTHAYDKSHKLFDSKMIRWIEKLYVTTGNETGSLVIPVGLAFDEAYRRRPDAGLHQATDGSHPSLLGTFLAASVVYASLYGQSPIGNTYDYYGQVPKDQVTFLQQVAHDTVNTFYGR